MESEDQTDNKLGFKKGMTLFQYMNEMTDEENPLIETPLTESAQNLYETCFQKVQKHPSTRLIPFNIPQMDQDNYQSSVDCGIEGTAVEFPEQEFVREQQTPKFRHHVQKCNDILITTMYNPKKVEPACLTVQKHHSKQYRIKHQSNSPHKKQYQGSAQKVQISKTLYGKAFVLSTMKTASSTIYQNKLKQNKLCQKANVVQQTPIHSRESKMEKYFQQKNKRQIDNLIFYEQNMQNKYNFKMTLLDMRVEGFKDKINERKNRIIH